jgi:hypothetical protein
MKEPQLKAVELSRKYGTDNAVDLCNYNINIDEKNGNSTAYWEAVRLKLCTIRGY